MKKHSTAVSMIALLAFVVPAASYAQVDIQARTEVRAERQEQRAERKDFQENRQEVRAEVREAQQEQRAELKDQRKDSRNLDEEARTEARAEMQENRAEARAEFKVDKAVMREDFQARRLELQEKITERRGEFKMRIASSTDAIRTQFTDKKKERVENFTKTMFVRFEGATEKLVSFSTRIQAQTEVISNKGGYTADVELSLQDANTAIEIAITDVAAAEAAVTASLENEDEISKEGLKEIVAVTKASIMDAHEALRNAIEQLKILNKTETE